MIADPDELRKLRALLKSRQGLPVEQCQVCGVSHVVGEIDESLGRTADEFGIPVEALKAPDQEAFLDARRQWLQEREAEFLGRFGLEMGDFR